MEEGYSQEYQKAQEFSPSKSSHSPKKQQISVMSASFSGKKSPASGKSSPSKSPNKSSWLRASDEDLLNRLKNIPRDPNSENDACNKSVTNIIEMVQNKLQNQLNEKINQRKIRKETEEKLRITNDNNVKIKSELYASEKYLQKIIVSNGKLADEVKKFEQKISEVEDQLDSIRIHGNQITAEEHAKLDQSQKYYDDLKNSVQKNLDEERAALEIANSEEKELVEILKGKTIEVEELILKIENFYSKESDRLNSFKSVTSTIEASPTKGSKILK